MLMVLLTWYRAVSDMVSKTWKAGLGATLQLQTDKLRQLMHMHRPQDPVSMIVLCYVQWSSLQFLLPWPIYAISAAF